MHIAVLAKVVPDYEVPAGDFELANGRAHARYTRMIGLYDENAIETGVQLKDKYGAQLSIISYGSADDISVLRKAVAMGGDTLTLVKGASDDPYVIAENLKMAVEKLGVVFLPKIAGIETDGDAWKVRQMHENGSRELKFSGKAVLSITSIPENVPRIPVVRAIFAAKKKPVEKMEGIAAAAMGVEELAVSIPKMESVCEFLPVDDMGQTAKTLLAKLREGRYL